MSQNLNYLCRDIIQTITNLFDETDYLSLVVYSEQSLFKKFKENIYDLSFYIDNYETLANSIQSFIRVGIAYYKLNKYKKAIKNFELAIIVFDNICFLVNADIEEDAIEALKGLKAYSEFMDENVILKSTIYEYIAHAQFKLKNNIQAYRYFKKALKFQKEENTSNYIKLLVCRSDACYELTKIYITTIKIIFFIIIFIWLFLTFKSNIITVIGNIIGLFKNYSWYFFLVVLLITLPSILYKIFYFCLRKLRKFVNVHSLQLFPKLIEKKLKQILNIINLKELIPYKMHRNAIKKIEELGNKDFDTLFAISKLYYCLGDYKTSTAYIQLALSTCNTITDKERYAMAYHYLARTAYKTGNHSTAINFYDKTIENLIEQKKEKDADDESIHSSPIISDMIKYSQENRDILEKTIFSRTYLPLIVTLIITMIVSIAQIYYNIHGNETLAKSMFKKCHNCYLKIIEPSSFKN